MHCGQNSNHQRKSLLHTLHSLYVLIPNDIDGCKTQVQQNVTVQREVNFTVYFRLVETNIASKRFFKKQLWGDFLNLDFASYIKLLNNSDQTTDQSTLELSVFENQFGISRNNIKVRDGWACTDITQDPASRFAREDPCTHMEPCWLHRDSA